MDVPNHLGAHLQYLLTKYAKCNFLGMAVAVQIEVGGVMFNLV